MNKLSRLPLNLSAILKAYKWRVSLTWLLTLFETALIALIPLFNGFAIDGLLESKVDSLLELAIVMTALILTGVARRIYDTRAYGTIKIHLSEALIERTLKLATSQINARMEMGRELIDFLEEQIPELMTSSIQLIISVIILSSFHPWLAYTAILACLGTLLIYILFHQRFFNLNAKLNHQKEQQVTVLGTGEAPSVQAYLKRLRDAEVKISDTESYVYGAIFVVLLTFICVNLWLATSSITLSVGIIFSIVSYSWEFVESSIILPTTLQSWSRLKEIIQRLNA